jgi:ribose-phosphate pyrophosphokinase
MQTYNPNKNMFYTTGRFAEEQAQGVESPRGRLLVASCRAGSYLAESVVKRYDELLSQEEASYQVVYLENVDSRFSDSETFVRLEEDVRGYDVFLFQALLDPRSEAHIDHNYVAFLIAVRAFREWGANHVTAVLPYLAYARQDKPTRFQREPTTAKLMADLSIEAGIDRLVTWHSHSPQTRGFYKHISVDVLEALTLFVQEFKAFQSRQDIVLVAPDAGASKFVTHLGRQLDLDAAVASKHRPRPEQAVVSQIMGDFTDKTTAIVIDDMISTGGTVYAVAKELVEKKGIKEIYLGVSHNLCMQQAYERLTDLYENYVLKKVVVTNSIPQTEAFQSLPFFFVRDLSDTFARVVNRIHYNRSLSELFPLAP